MTSPTISVIVPVYNVEKYLPKCIDSIIDQTYGKLDIILVNDGSSDGSSQICDEYAKKDRRIRVIHKNNGGLSSARNAGLDVANGQFIAFLDSDDWIEPEMYEVLLNLSITYNADISSCASRNVYLGDTSIPQNNEKEKPQVYEGDDIIKELLSQDNIRFEVWNKLWSRKIIGGLRFKVGQVSEDVFWDRKLFSLTNKIVHTNRVLHNYLLERPGNTNAKFRMGRLCVFDEFDEWIKDLDAVGRHETAQVIGCIAIGFAVSIYLESKRTKQNKAIVNQLRDSFYKYNVLIKGCPFRNKKSIALFRFSPLLYQILIGIKTMHLAIL